MTLGSSLFLFCSLFCVRRCNLHKPLYLSHPYASLFVRIQGSAFLAPVFCFNVLEHLYLSQPFFSFFLALVCAKTFTWKASYFPSFACFYYHIRLLKILFYLVHKIIKIVWMSSLFFSFYAGKRKYFQTEARRAELERISAGTEKTKKR